MKKKTTVKTHVIVALICAILVVALTAISLYSDFPKKRTVIEFVDDAVIVKSNNGKKVTLIEEYQTYISAGEELSVGDKVIIRNGLFSDLSIHRVDK
ncbi:MAG: hypothetical protein IKK00_05715 [Oscillospiraceae bacterium]|nr:hypothetical protein [Oscillospiraceae bacterium]